MRLHENVTNKKSINGFKKFSDYCKYEAFLINDEYDYSEVVYENTQTKVKIICFKHGGFMQTPTGHLRGCGCGKCGRDKKRKTTEQFIDKAKTVHGDEYDYSEVVYKGAQTKVKIICSKHGGFMQTPDTHSQGHGCNDCCNDKIRKTAEQFIDKAKTVHGDEYDYSEVVYKGAHTKVKIICSKHGGFMQTPNNHLQGNGCPKCSKGSDNDILYIWEAVGEKWNDMPYLK